MSEHKEINVMVGEIDALMKKLEVAMSKKQEKKHNGKLISNWERNKIWIQQRLDRGVKEKKDPNKKVDDRKVCIYTKRNGDSCTTKTKHISGFCGCHRYSKQAREHQK